MIWLFFVVAAIAIAFIVLGAMSVWVAMLSMALKVILMLLVPVGLYVLWQQFSRRKS